MKQTKRIPVEAQADIQFSQYFLNRDIKGAIAYMREREEFKDILPAYTAIFCFSFEA